MHVRPPKEVWLATYKSPSDRKWVSFLPILELKCVHVLLWSFSCFSSSPSYFYEFHGCFEEFSSLDQSFESLETQGVVSSHLQVRARTNPRSSRGSDPRNRGV
ncbi:hypothetical protein MANES_08G095811v8 [Manihot esculenta]|uniref:Uncharacterized protein n=1 Tax=Manihot esculenta TaxID=3983 RepID=A0ACB7HA46_MANES|nr:hypothetical protein MANES_08G095811v8 [Manihot esculenta]